MPALSTLKNLSIIESPLEIESTSDKEAFEPVVPQETEYIANDDEKAQIFERDEKGASRRGIFGSFPR